MEKSSQKFIKAAFMSIKKRDRFTQKSFSKRSGISENQISNWLQGDDYNFSPARVEYIAKLLKTTVEEMEVLGKNLYKDKVRIDIRPALEEPIISKAQTTEDDISKILANTLTQLTKSYTGDIQDIKSRLQGIELSLEKLLQYVSEGR